MVSFTLASWLVNYPPLVCLVIIGLASFGFVFFIVVFSLGFVYRIILGTVDPIIL